MDTPYRPANERSQQAARQFMDAVYELDPQLVRKIAENENPPALFSATARYAESVIRHQFIYGVMLYEGKKLPRDYAEAFRWFTKAADKGNSDAMHALGMCHLMGHVTVRDSAKASEWFRKSAELGNPDAQNNLGNCYSNGDGVPADLEQAAHWWMQAALQHVPQAQFNTGCMALQLEDDPIKAYFWWRIVGAKHPKAPESLRQLIELMDPETLREAERRYAAALSSDHGP